MTDALFEQEPYKSRQGDFNVRVLHLPTGRVRRAPALGPTRRAGRPCQPSTTSSTSSATC